MKRTSPDPLRIASLIALSATLGLGCLTACKTSSSESGGGSGVRLSGAGSTFVYPVMTRWVAAFTQSHPGAEINYQSIGSGGGIEQVKAGTVDFGASDAALNDQQLAAMKPVIQIPESAGPVCITYNLAGLSTPLQLSGQTLADIYLGTVTNWQDQAIKRDNPNVKLPNTKIVVTHRAEGSGTTSIFTTYLATISSAWQQKVGKGTSVSWPIGLGGKGSEGVTGLIRQAPGAIGYVELTYAEQNKLPVAAIRNLADKYVVPSGASTTADIAAFAAQLATDPRTPIVNPPGSAADAYPIAGLTFLIIPKDGPGMAKRTALKEFVSYIISDGQAVAGGMAYAPLPDSVKHYDLTKLTELTADGKLVP
jgi:phosphate transport system substrate-binding protein